MLLTLFLLHLHATATLTLEPGVTPPGQVSAPNLDSFAQLGGDSPGQIITPDSSNSSQLPGNPPGAEPAWPAGYNCSGVATPPTLAAVAGAVAYFKDPANQGLCQNNVSAGAGGAGMITGSCTQIYPANNAPAANTTADGGAAIRLCSRFPVNPQCVPNQWGPCGMKRLMPWGSVAVPCANVSTALAWMVLQPGCVQSGASGAPPVVGGTANVGTGQVVAPGLDQIGSEAGAQTQVMWLAVGSAAAAAAA